MTESQHEEYDATWNRYASSWKPMPDSDRRKLFASSLAESCHYKSPAGDTQGWDELAEHMEGFQEQLPGGHFVTTQFLTNQATGIAKWEMRDGDETVVGDGMSYCTFDDDGHLTLMAGFFEVPAS